MRFFHASDIPESGNVVTLTKQESDHLFGTLRGRVGEYVGLLNGHGVEAEAEIIAGKQLLVHKKIIHPEPHPKIHLFCAAPRRKELDLLLKQCVEAGAWSINLLECERSVAIPDGSALERWQTIAIEGCKQSRNFWAPIISPPVQLKSALAELNGNSNFCKLYGHVAHDKKPIIPQCSDYALFIGPEGGFTADEETLMESCGVMPWHFSHNVSRLENAAVCGVMLLNYLTGVYSE